MIEVVLERVGVGNSESKCTTLAVIVFILDASLFAEVYKRVGDACKPIVRLTLNLIAGAAIWR
jgi:hypothetical protein